MQAAILKFTESSVFQSGVLILIILNAAILGIETLPSVSEGTLKWLLGVDHIIIYLFFFEVVLRFIGAPKFYFRSLWNIFDFVIVLVSLIAANSGIASIRAFRVLRVLRVITVMPRMRLVVAALLDSIPGIASVGVVLVIILYVFAVLAANLYGPAHPAIFGDVFTAMYSLFTVMTLEGWREIADEVALSHPSSWIFFLSFILIATFTMLNLFVAIVVRVVEEDAEEIMEERSKAIRDDIAELRDDIRKLDTLLQTQLRNSNQSGAHEHE
ncbi:MAG: ion transporter [Pseudomonadota bacterium]